MRQSFNSQEDDYNIFNKKKISVSSNIIASNANQDYENSQKKSSIRSSFNNDKLLNAQKILDNQKEKMERNTFGQTSSIGFLSIKNTFPNNNLQKNESLFDFNSPIVQRTNRIDEIDSIASICDTVFLSEILNF